MFSLRTSLRSIIVPALLLSLLACAPKMKAPQSARPLSPTFAPLNSLSALVEASVTRRGRHRNFQAALLAKAPHFLRISFLDDLGREMAVLAADGSRVVWWDHDRDEVEVYPQNGDALQRALKLPLGVEEFVQILLAGPTAVAPDANFQLQTKNLQEDPKYPRNWFWQFRKPRADLEMEFMDLQANPILGMERFELEPIQ